MSKRKNISATQKNAIAADQLHTCKTVIGYNCPLNGKTFDQAGYEIDHIIELADGGTEERSNLQALCPSCHRYKTFQSKQNRAKKKKVIQYLDLQNNLTNFSIFANPQEYVANLLDWKNNENLDEYLTKKSIPYTKKVVFNIVMGNNVDAYHIDIDAFIKSLPKYVQVTTFLY